jgi:riboflavin biosynthesis pyrimidine reductase
MRLLLGPPAADVPVAGAELTLGDLEHLYGLDADAGPQEAFVRANMVIGLDGAIATDGVSAGLSGPADKDVFAVLRAWADVVLVGAGTARAEQYRPASIRPELRAGRTHRGQATVPRIAVVSRSLELDLGSALMQDVSTLVVTGAGADASRLAELRRHHDVIVAGEGAVDLGQAVINLHRMGLTRILCEGGPSLLGDLVAEGLINDLCLSLAPVVGGGTHSGLFGAATFSQRRLRMRHVIESDGFLMTRYAFTRHDGDDR